MTEKIDKYPTNKTAGDVSHSAMRAVAGMIPICGAPIAEILNMIVAPPLEKRRNKWFEDIGNCLKDLSEQENLSLEDLRDNEEFIDIVIQASQTALKTSQSIKKEALKNAVIHAASDIAPDLSLQQMFINFIDSFTEWHIKLLDLFSDPLKWEQKNSRNLPKLVMGGLADIVESAFPELKEKRDIYDQIWKDLNSRGLVNTGSLHGTMTGRGLLEKRATTIGEEFIKYITSPE